MLGFGAKTSPTPDATIHGWREADLQFLEKQLSHERPLIQLQITGFRQIFSVDGASYASAIRRNRADHEEYAKFALAFEGVPDDEDRLGLVNTQNELIGSLRFPSARVEGRFELATNVEDVKAGNVGSFSLTGKGGIGDEPYSPLIQFSLLLQSRDEEKALGWVLQSALGVSSHAFLNLVLHKVDDPKSWIGRLRDDGYTPSLTLQAAHFTTEVGRGPFN